MGDMLSTWQLVHLAMSHSLDVQHLSAAGCLQVRLVEDEHTYGSYGEAYEANCARYGREVDLPIVLFKRRCSNQTGQLVHDPAQEMRMGVRPELHDCAMMLYMMLHMLAKQTRNAQVEVGQLHHCFCSQAGRPCTANSHLQRWLLSSSLSVAEDPQHLYTCVCVCVCV